MILTKGNYNINLFSVTNFVFGLFPISFILGNMAINLNLVLFCCLGFLSLKSKIITDKLDFSVKIISLFFVIIFFSTTLTFVKSLYFLEYESSDLVRLVKSLTFFRFFLTLIIIYLLTRYNLLNFKYFLIFAFLCPLLVSLDIIFQYILGFNMIGFKSQMTHNSSFFGDELIAGGFIKNFSFFPIFFIIFFFKNNNYFKYIFTILIINLLGVGIILSGNRMPFILFLLGIFLTFFFNTHLRKVVLMGLILLLTSFGSIMYFDNDIRVKYKSYYGNATYLLSKLFNQPDKDSERKYSIEDTLKMKNKKIIEQQQEEKKEISKPTFIDETKNPWEKFLNPPKWDGENLHDDFEFFWVLQSQLGGHVKLYLTAINTWEKNKIFGNGIKSFREDCQKLVIHKSNRLCSNHPHNYYLEILTDTGIVGILNIIVIVFLFIFFIFKNYRSLNVNSKENLILFVATISLIIEAFPLRSTGSIFSTTNATYLILIASIIVSHKKILEFKDNQKII